MKTEYVEKWTIDTRLVVEHIYKLDEAYSAAKTPAERAYVYFALIKLCDEVSSSAKKWADMLNDAAINGLLGRKQ